MNNRVSKIVFSIVVALFILSLSIAVPILVRGLYYWQIDSLNLVERTGYSEEVIREAFDEMMDYCTQGGPSGKLEFGTGKLAWSEWGKTHFDDVSKLFTLDLTILKITTIAIVLYVAMKFFRPTAGELPAPDRAGERGPLFWGPAGLLVAIAIIGGAAAINFNRFFVVFHQVFFPGKENWIFDERYDEIIKILPEEVFRNFAIVIGIAVVVLSAASIGIDYWLRRGRRVKAEVEPIIVDE